MLTISVNVGFCKHIAESLAISYAVERLTGFDIPCGLSKNVAFKSSLAQFLFISERKAQTGFESLNSDSEARKGF